MIKYLGVFHRFIFRWETRCEPNLIRIKILFILTWKVCIKQQSYLKMGVSLWKFYYSPINAFAQSKSDVL